MQWIHVTFEPIMCVLEFKQRILPVFWSPQIENQRQCRQRFWRDGRGGSTHHYGLPPNYFPKRLVSLGDSRHVNTKHFDYT